MLHAILILILDPFSSTSKIYVLAEEVLQGVHAGIDLFDTTYGWLILLPHLVLYVISPELHNQLRYHFRYIYHLTIGGFALVFPLDNGDGPVHDYVPHYEGGDFTKINLRATIYRSALDISSVLSFTFILFESMQLIGLSALSIVA